MRKETEAESPILTVCRTLEQQSEVPWNNDSLHSAMKGAEPGENSRRLKQLFLGSSKNFAKVLHPERRSCWHKLGALGRAGGSAPLRGCACLQLQAEPTGSHLGTTELGRAATPQEFGGWSRGDAGGTPGRVTGSPQHLPTSGRAGTVFGTEGLSGVKLLIKHIPGLWL